MNDYKSLRKAINSRRTIAIIMAVLIVVEMCSLAMLFSRVITYSTDSSRYVISLTEGAERSRMSEIDTSKTGFIVPTSVVDPDTLIEPIDQVNTLDFGFSTYDVDRVWTTDTDFDVFHLSYDETGSVTVQSDLTGVEKVFAPGTMNSYTFTVSNTGSHNLDYLVYIEASIDAHDENGEELWLPITARFRKGDGSFIVGDSSDNWPDYLELDQSGDLSSLNSGSTMNYTVDWQWPFERTDGDGLDANDAYDTMLGNLAAEGAQLKATIRIKTVAWWEDYWYATADVKEGSGTADVTPDKVLQGSDDTFTFTAVPDEGWEFVGWEFGDDNIYEIIDGSLTDPTLVVKPGSDLDAHAIFKPIETEPGIDYWYATADVKEGEGNATVDPAKVIQNSDDTFTFVATPDEGWEFVGWEFGDDNIYEIIDGSLTDPTLVVKPGSDLDAHAIFKPIETEPPTTPPTEPKTEPKTEPPTTPPTEPKTEPPTTPPTEPPTTPPTTPPTEPPTTPPTTPPTEPPTTPPTTPPTEPPTTPPTQPPTQPGIDYWFAYVDVIEGEGTADVNPTFVVQDSDDTFTFTAVPEEGWEFIGWEFDDGDIYEIVGGSLTDTVIIVKPGSDVHAHARFRPVSTEAPTQTPTEIKPTTAPTEPSPQPGTGDQTHTIFWLILSIGAFIALIIVFFVYRRIRKAEKAGQRFND